MNLHKPKEWSVKPLEKLLEFVIGGDWGKDISHNEADFELAYCIRGSEIRNWKEDKGKTASLRKIKSSSIKTRKLKEGDILVEISGGGPEQPVGRTVLIDRSVLKFEPNVPKISTNFLRLIRPTSEVHSSYLNQYLQLFYSSGDIVNYQGGSNNLRNLKFPDYLKIVIPYPSDINQQLLIVSKLEELFSKLDNGVESLKTLQQQLKVYRQAVLKWAFEGRLTNANVKDGELPEGWRIGTIGEVLEVFVGSTPSRKNNSFWNGNINWVSSGEVAFCKINSTKEKISEEGLKNSSCKVHPKGTVILAMIGEGKTRGQAAILRIDASHNQNTAAIRIPEGVYSSELLYYFLFLKYEENRRIGSGNNQKALNKERVKTISLPVIPFSEQDKIVQEIESRLSVCDKIEETITNGLKEAEALRQSILKLAFEGKLL